MKKIANEKAAGKKTVGKKKTRRHFNALLKMSDEERRDFFEKRSVPDLVKVLEDSYASDLVNIWLEMKRSTIRDMFQKIVQKKKRALLPAAILYYYKQYLTNPLPLDLKTLDGGMLPNYYAVVGMDREASGEDLKEACKLLRKAHAETVFSPKNRPSGRQTLEDINEAFSVLNSESKRRVADSRLPSIHYLYPRRDQSWLEEVKRLYY